MRALMSHHSCDESTWETGLQLLGLPWLLQLLPSWLAKSTFLNLLTVLHFLYLRAAVRVAVLPGGGRNKSLHSCPADTTLLRLPWRNSGKYSPLGRNRDCVHLSETLNTSVSEHLSQLQEELLPPTPHKVRRESILIFLKKKKLKTQHMLKTPGWYKL